MRPRSRGLLVNAVLLTVSGLFGLGLAEAAVRFVLPSARRYYVLVPGSSSRWHVPPGMLPGVSGPARYTVNRAGMRGRAFGPDEEEYRLIAVGGSTTECVLLDDTLAWTYGLEVNLAKTADGRRVWVGNVGRSAHTTRQHAVQLKYLLSQFPRMDAVVALVGANDMLGSLARGRGYRRPPPITQPEAEREQLGQAFAWLPGQVHGPPDQVLRPWYRATALWQLARRVRWLWRPARDVPLEDGFRSASRIRAAAARVSAVPTLAEPLVEFRLNLAAMIAATRAAGSRLILVTQPTIWRQGLPPAVERLLWFGWIGTGPDSATAYYTPAALAEAMHAYNAVLLEVCRTSGVECVDAAADLPKDTTVFFDDVHFNVAGSSALADLLTTHLLSRPPFLRDPDPTVRH